MPDKVLLREFEYFIAHQDQLAQQYDGRVLVIKDEAVIGVYDTELEAVRKTSEEHELGTFLVQRCAAGPECYTAVFHGSRVAFG